jgi:hypothetical protein
MPTVLILAAAAMGLVLVVLAVVVIGIRQEPSAQELTNHAPRLIARLARRFAGVYVRRPDPSVISDRPDASGHRSAASDRTPSGG